MSADDRPTPKESGSLVRWPIFEKFAREVALRLKDEHPQEARDANALSAEFRSWEVRDPGIEARMRAIGRLFVLRELAGM